MSTTAVHATRKECELDRLVKFKRGLPSRLAATLDRAVVSVDETGISIAFPEDESEGPSLLEGYRFHVVGAAAAAFGRPMCVEVVTWDGFYDADPEPGELEGCEVADMRSFRRAETHPLVAAVVKKFDGRVVAVEKEGEEDGPEVPAGR